MSQILDKLKASIPSQFSDSLGHTLQQSALPALALGAGTGALSGYLSSKPRMGEDSRERRHRIIRNALLGAALGTTAGVALPAGLQMLNTPLHPENAVEGAGDAVTGFAGRHILPLAAGIGGGLGLRHSLLDDKKNALETLRASLNAGDPLRFQDKNVKNVSTLMHGHGIAGAKDLAFKYQAGKQGLKAEMRNAEGKMQPNPDVNSGDLHSIFQANELMQEAGHPGMSLKDVDALSQKVPYAGSLGPKVDHGIWPNTAVPPGQARSAFLDYMDKSGPIGGLLSRVARKGKLPFAENLAKIPGVGGAISEFDPIHLAEGYSRYMRPSVGALTDRLPLPLKWGLLGGGILGANELQKRLAGQ